MNEKFEEWFSNDGRYIDSLLAINSEEFKMLKAWQASREAALREAAEVCGEPVGNFFSWVDRFGEEMLTDSPPSEGEYKTIPVYTTPQPDFRDLAERLLAGFKGMVKAWCAEGEGTVPPKYWDLIKEAEEMLKCP